MKTPQHTPGPWQLGEEGGILEGHTPIDAAGWEGLAQVVTKMEFDGYNAEGQANARLIAAAPDLLAALEDLTSYMIDHGMENDAGVVKAIEAIGVAKGELL